MLNSERGSTYIEVLVALIIILLLLNPLFSGLISLKKNLNRVNIYEVLENEIEKIRVFYKKNSIESKYISIDDSFEIEIQNRNVYEDFYILKISISKEKLKRERVLYVYKQK
ncbi:hypothetical protein [Cetobacterium sp.]|uniref:hypothetical protein n=1 Tax=Cetobacterium sp. TaxID=2071632 RepID=UPI0025ECA53D|nr:hypothetical protein [uncultured Cetobacterium sp.]